MPPSDFASNITDPVSIELRLDIFHAKAKSSLTSNCLLLEQAANSSIVQYLGSWQRLINSSTKGTHHHAHAPYKSAGLDQQRRTGGRCSPRQRSFSRVYARTCFITPYSRRLGRSSISDRHSPALSLRLFSSFFASTFPFLSLSLLHTNQKRSWPNEQVAKRASTPGCGDLTRVLRKATYVFAVFPSFCSLLAFSYYLSDIGVFGKSIEGTDVNRDESDFLGWLKQPSSCKGNWIGKKIFFSPDVANEFFSIDVDSI